MSTAVELLAEHAGAAVYHAAWPELAAVVEAAGGCDAVLVDAPYSERTHAGHDARSDAAVALGRRAITYAPWTPGDVAAFVTRWAPLARGWIVSLTDDVLAPCWRAELEARGRCTFAPLPFVQFGSRVRLSGDGPSSITTWIVVARPRTHAYSTWGTLPGAYVQPPGYAERPDIVGGKTLWIAERLCEDYSRPGDLIVDPCCGAGTTLRAAQQTGRRAIGGDVLRAHAELAARRIMQPAQQPLLPAVGAPR